MASNDKIEDVLRQHTNGFSKYGTLRLFDNLVTQHQGNSEKYLAYLQRMANTKTYTTSERTFRIPSNDFNIISEIHATRGGVYSLHIGSQMIDQRELNGDESRLYFLGKNSMDLLVYMLPMTCTTIVKDHDEEVTYTIKGRVYDNMPELMLYEELHSECHDSYMKQVTYPFVTCDEDKLMKRKIEVPIVAFGMLNFLYYHDGCAALKYWLDN